MASSALPSSSFILFNSSSSPTSSSSSSSPSFIRLASTLRPPFRRLGFSESASDASFSQHVLSKIHAFSSLSSKPIRGVASMAKKSVGDLSSSDLKGKKVFVRADLNVPLDDSQNITDDTRIRAAIPTIKHLINNGVKVILSSHLVVKADDCFGPEVEKLVAALPEGGVLLLENVRFYKEEEKNDPEFAKKLASLADLHVNDAFGTGHRAHASTEGVTKYLKPSVAGFLLQKLMMYKATSLLEKAKAKGVSLFLPSDVVIAEKFAADADSKIVSASEIPDGWMGLDIGPDSIKKFSEALDTTQTVIWNGPMGVFEFDKFTIGTEAIAKKLEELSKKGVTTIIGGGDSVAAVEKVGVAELMSHISTGGGVSLELLEGKELPGVLALDEAEPVPA